MTTISVSDTSTILSDFLNFPVELWIEILSHADFRDIVRCNGVCKKFQNIIHNSVLLQYRIELAVAGYVDGSDGDGSHTNLPQADHNQTVTSHTLMSQLTTAKRLEKLRKLERAWRNLSFKYVWTHDQVLGSASIYEFSGGVFVRGSRTDPTRRGVSSLQIIVPPSSFHGSADFEPGVEPQSWEHRLGSTCARDIGVDPGADLLVLIEQDPSRYNIHLKLLSTNKPHPLAEHPLLNHEPRHPSVDYSFTINVFDDILGLLFCAPPADDRRSSELVIWNWKRGRVLSTLYISNFIGQSFAFLSHCTFLLPHVTTRQVPGEDGEGVNEDDERVNASLRIYSFGTESDEPHARLEKNESTLSPTLIAIFRLPTFSTNVQDCELSVRSDPQPCPQYFPTPSLSYSGPPTGSGHSKGILQARRKPFYPDPLQRVFVISIILIVRRQRLMRAPILSQRSYTMFVHSNAFIDLCGRSVIEKGIITLDHQHRQRTPPSSGNSPSTSRSPKWRRSLLLSPTILRSKLWQDKDVLEPTALRAAGASFEWDAWSDYARWTTLAPRGNFVCYVYGQRFIGWATSRHDESELFIWDFNQHVIRQMLLSKRQKDIPSNPDPIEFGGADLRDSGRPDETGCNVEETELFDKHVFEEGGVKSSLPFRRISIPFETANPCAGIMLDDERIVVIVKQRSTIGLAVNILGIEDESEDEGVS